MPSICSLMVGFSHRFVWKEEFCSVGTMRFISTITKPGNWNITMTPDGCSPIEEFKYGSELSSMVYKQSRKL